MSEPEFVKYVPRRRCDICDGLFRRDQLLIRIDLKAFACESCDRMIAVKDE